MDVPYFKGRHPYKILSQHEWHKKGKYIEAYLRDNSTSCHSYSQNKVVRKETNSASKQPDASLLTK